MMSLSDARRRLADGFISILQSMYSPLTIDRVISAMITDRPVTLRANTIKTDAGLVREGLRAARIKFENVEWNRDAFVLPEATERDVEKLELYTSGKVYLQSLSSMIPVPVLDPAGGEKILDLTAAPGSKTTQIAAMTANGAEIVACELDKIRFERLLYNIEVQGAVSVKALNVASEKLLLRHPGYASYFDRVLLDAPCSGEGRFSITHPATYRRWSEKEVRGSSNLQMKLMKSAVDCLKPGGILVYSTCTINMSENEEVVSRCLREFGLKTLDIGIRIHGSLPGLTTGFDPSLSKAMRILPSRLMEGFFVCRMRKDKK